MSVPKTKDKEIYADISEVLLSKVDMVAASPSFVGWVSPYAKTRYLVFYEEAKQLVHVLETGNST